MAKLLFTILVTFLSSSLPLFSQQWYKSGIPHGRDINAVQIFSPDTILAAGGWLFNDSVRSVFKTYNASFMWNVYMDDNAHWIKSVEFSDENNGVVVGDGGTIMHTADGGVNWTPGNVPILRNFNSIFFIDSLNYVIVGGEPGDSTQPGVQTILKTTNGGQSWNVVFDQAGPWLKSVYFIDAQTGFAVGDQGAILKTVNGGNSWAFVFTPLQRDFNAVHFSDDLKGFIVGGNFSNDSIQTILETDNGGNTWNINRDVLGGWLTDVFFLNRDTGYVVGDDATVLRTTDAGGTWTPQMLNGAAGDEHLNAVRFYSEDYGVAAGRWGTFYIYTQADIPEAYATAADLIDSTEALIHGVVNTHGNPARYYVIYSEDSSLSLFNSFETLPRDIRSHGFSNIQLPLIFLTPDTTYYYTLKASSLAGESNTSDTLSFFTGATGNEIKTLPSPALSGTSATLSGSVKGFTDPVDLFFQYGESPAFGNEVAASPASVNDASFHTVTATLSSLQPNTLYYFRLKGVSNGQNYYGNTYPFYTGQVYTTLQAKPATNVTDSSATLNGVVSGFRVPVTVSFQKSDNDSVFYDMPNARNVGINDTSTHMISQEDTSLSPGVNYFRLKASSVLGVFYSNSAFFFPGQGDYRMTTLDASLVTDSSAKLNGRVTGFSEAVNLSFQYGATPLLNNVITATPDLINDTLQHFASAVINGLQNGTVYYYRMVAENNAGDRFFSRIREVYIGEPTIPNWDFQEWDDDTTALVEDWLVVSDRFERVPGHSGNYALRVFDQNIVVLGLIKVSQGEPAFQGIPYNFRPDSIIVWCNYDIPLADSILAMMVGFGNQGNVVGENFFPINGTSGGNFERLAFKIDYTSSLMPDSVSIVIFLNHPDASLTIDDISFSPAAAPPLPNNGFEEWFLYPNLSLRSWVYPKYLVADHIPENTIMVTRTYFTDSTDYAAELRNIDLHGDGTYITGQISSSMGFLGSPRPSFPVYHKPTTLNGYFKYFPVPGDTLDITINLTKNGEYVGEGTFLYTDSVTQFKAFSLPIIYNDPGVVPDSAMISISCMTNDFPVGPSRLVIDKLSFDGFYGSDPFTLDTTTVIDTTITDTTNTIPFYRSERVWEIYPNPGKDVINIYLNVKLSKAELVIYDLSGKIIYRKQPPLLGQSGEILEISLEDFSSGFYIATLEHSGGRESEKLIVMK